MGLVFDSCVFIHMERHGADLDFNKIGSDEAVFISAITVSELLIGVHRASTQKRRLKRSAFVESILSEVPVLEFTAEVARLHTEIYAYLAKKDKLIGAHDLIIAATALVNDCAVLTSNGEKFNRVPGLKVLNFATKLTS